MADNLWTIELERVAPEVVVGDSARALYYRRIGIPLLGRVLSTNVVCFWVRPLLTKRLWNDILFKFTEMNQMSCNATLAAYTEIYSI